MGEEYWLTLNYYKDEIIEIDVTIKESFEIAALDIFLKEKKCITKSYPHQPCEADEKYSVENCTKGRIYDLVQPNCTIPGTEENMSSQVSNMFLQPFSLSI